MSGNILIVNWIKEKRIDFWNIEETMNSDGTKVDAHQMNATVSLDSVKLNNCLRIVADSSVVLCIGNRPWDSESKDRETVSSSGDWSEEEEEDEWVKSIYC